MRDPRPLPQNAEAALWMLASVTGASAMTVAVRLMTPELHTAMIAFLRAVFVGLLVLPLFWIGRRGAGRLSFSAWPLHLIRGGLVAIALNAGFYAIWKLPLATATILFFLAPAFATALAALALGEGVGIRRGGAIAAGLIGAAIILRPGVGDFEPAMLAAVVSSLAFAASLILGRVVSARDGSTAVFVSSSLVVAVATLPPALFVWALPATPAQWTVLAVLVLASSLRTYADIRAYAAGEAGFIAPFSYLRLVILGAVGYLWFGERIDLATVIGGAVIIAATLYISLREARLKRRGAPPDPD